MASFLDAALIVLDSARTPMSSHDIVAEAVRRGLLVTRGATPHKSMDAVLYAAALDENPLVVKVGEKIVSRARQGSVRWMRASR